MSVVGKHILTGTDVEMTRRIRDGMLLFTVTDHNNHPPNDIVLEIDPGKLKGAFGPRGIVVPSWKGAILTHRECDCPISGKGGTILPCVCPPPKGDAPMKPCSQCGARLPDDDLLDGRCLWCRQGGG